MVLGLKKQTLMARQPIVDMQKQTIAYELLYRSNTKDTEARFDFSGSIATIHVLLNSLTSIYKQKKITRVPAFVNFTSDLLINNTLPELPSNQIVLEVLEDVDVTPELVNALKKFRTSGYKIALDDFIYDERYIPLLEIAQIVKVDVMGLSFDEIREQVNKLKPYKLTLLAEKIETHEVFQFCSSIGFRLFQGYFLSRPEIIEGKKVEPSKIHLLKIIRELENPDVKVDKLSELILKDPIFTFKMLRIINSSTNQLVRNIESIEEVINLLGVTELKKWALIITMVSNPSKSDEISRQLLIRGRMCERIAIANGVNNSTSYMIAGILSGLDALLDMEMDDLLEQVSLSSEIKNAINEGNGDIGEVLYNTISYNLGEWGNISKGIDESIYNTAYLESLSWANETFKALESM